MIVKAYQCPSCRVWVWSRARHDMRHCQCGDLFVDGGFDYCRVGGRACCNKLKSREFEVDCSIGQAYDDWNTSTDNYGHIFTEWKHEELEPYPYEYDIDI